MVADVDWTGADGSAGRDVEPSPDVQANTGSGVNHEPDRCDIIFGEFMDRHVAHFICSRGCRQLEWTESARSRQKRWTPLCK